jgi:hypothetical protein
MTNEFKEGVHAIRIRAKDLRREGQLQLVGSLALGDDWQSANPNRGLDRFFKGLGLTGHTTDC